MIEFFKKNQDNLTKGAAAVLLLICYFQQRELAKLRKEVHSVNEIKVGGGGRRGGAFPIH